MIRPVPPLNLLTHVTTAVVNTIVAFAQPLVVVYGSEGRSVRVLGLVDERGGGIGRDSVITAVVEGLHGYRGYLWGVVEILLGRRLGCLPHHVGYVRAEGFHCKDRFRIVYLTLFA